MTSTQTLDTADGAEMSVKADHTRASHTRNGLPARHAIIHVAPTTVTIGSTTMELWSTTTTLVADSPLRVSSTITPVGHTFR